MKRIYLAGPTVFLADAEARFRRMKEILAGIGLEGVAPSDNQLGLENIAPGSDLARAIYSADEALMNFVDGAIFNTDPFRRGTEMDAGTAFEIGYCRARGLPLTAWCVDGRSYPAKVKAFMETVFGEGLVEASRNAQGATSGALRDADGVLVHSEGLYQNLMIDMSICASGGETFAHEDWETAFEQAGKRMAQLVLQRPEAQLSTARTSGPISAG